MSHIDKLNSKDSTLLMHKCIAAHCLAPDGLAASAEPNTEIAAQLLRSMLDGLDFGNWPTVE